MTVTAQATFGQVFAEPVFRALFATRVLAIAAETLRIVALSMLVYEATDSPLLGAVTYGIGFLPQVAGGVLLGAVADRVPPRRLIVAGYLLQGATAAVLALAPLPIWASLVLVAGVACVTPLFGAAASRLVADALAGDAYVLGRSVLGMASSAAQLVGLAGGGLAVGLLGPRHALLAGAAAHLVAALGARLRLPWHATATADDGATASGARASGALRQSLAGTRLLASDRTVRALLLAQWLPPAFVVGAESLLIPYAAERGFPPGAPGLLLACVPAGMLVGDLVVGRFVGPRRRERLFVPLIVALGLPLVALPIGPALPVAAGLLAVSGAGFAYGLSIQRRFLDAVPADERGHAFALLGTGLMTLQGAGPMLFGALSELVGVGAAIALAGAATLATAAALSGVARGTTAD